MTLVKGLHAFLSVATGRYEIGGVGGQSRHRGKRIAGDVADDSKLFWHGAEYWSRFERNRLVLLFGRGKGGIGRIVASE